MKSEVKCLQSALFSTRSNCYVDKLIPNKQNAIVLLTNLSVALVLVVVILAGVWDEDVFLVGAWVEVEEDDLLNKYHVILLYYSITISTKTAGSR